MTRAFGSTIIAAAVLVGVCHEGRAIELITGDGYLIALAQDEASRKAADDYLAGTLDSLIVMNEVLSTEDDRMFCLSDERAALLDAAILRREFTEWLRTPPKGAGTEREQGQLPISLLGWAFLGSKFPCKDTAPEGIADDIRSKLLDTMRD
jgi:hypothetical protein